METFGVARVATPFTDGTPLFPPIFRSDTREKKNVLKTNGTSVKVTRTALLLCASAAAVDAAVMANMSCGCCGANGLSAAVSAVAGASGRQQRRLLEGGLVGGGRAR